MSIADPVAAPPLAGVAGAIVPVAAPATVLKPTISALAAGERELRIDLFRGLALWLIYIDHVSPDLLTWFTIRSYGFSDGAEIFIFISGFTAAFVYGRGMRQAGVVITEDPAFAEAREGHEALLQQVEGIRAETKDGVLRIHIPKVKTKKSEPLGIEVH